MFLFLVGVSVALSVRAGANPRDILPQAFGSARALYYPAFNIADSAICIGVALMLFDNLLHREEKKT